MRQHGLIISLHNKNSGSCPGGFHKNLNKMSISVVINTYNSALHLARVLESVKGFDETVVCDMESTDNTLDIARAYGAKIATFPRGDNMCIEPARNYAIRRASHEWVLVVDDDEIVPAALRRYLYRYTGKKNADDGLYLPRRNFIMDRFRRATYPDYQLRFLRRDKADWPPFVHSVPKIDGTIGKIPSNRMELALIHIPPTMSALLGKLNAYTTAETDLKDAPAVTLPSIMFKPLGKFVSAYLLRGGFRYGIPGFIAACHQAVYQLYKQAKLYEDRLKCSIPREMEEADEE